MDATGISHLRRRRLPTKKDGFRKKLWLDVRRLQHRIFVRLRQGRLAVHRRRCCEQKCEKNRAAKTQKLLSVVSHLASEFQSIGRNEYINWFAKVGLVAMSYTPCSVSLG